jgi:hypothetical protein
MKAWEEIRKKGGKKRKGKKVELDGPRVNNH